MKSAGAAIDEEAVKITVLIADYIFETFGRFLATVPPILLKMYLQAHRLNTEFYDRHHAEGGYLRTHASHDLNCG